jgi:hypothetical protein
MGQRIRQGVIALDYWISYSPTWDEQLGRWIDNHPLPYTGSILGGLVADARLTLAAFQRQGSGILFGQTPLDSPLESVRALGLDSEICRHPVVTVRPLRVNRAGAPLLEHQNVAFQYEMVPGYGSQGMGKRYSGPHRYRRIGRKLQDPDDDSAAVSA